MDILNVLFDFQVDPEGVLGKIDPKIEQTIELLYQVISKIDNQVVVRELDNLVLMYASETMEAGYRQGFIDCFQLFMDIQKKSTTASANARNAYKKIQDIRILARKELNYKKKLIRRC